MRNFLHRLFAASAACLFVVASAQASGFQIGEMAARATGMGSAFTAVADDPSAAWYNPAGVGFTDGKQIMGGSAIVIVPGTDFTTNTFNPLHPKAVSAGSNTFFVPHVYFTYMDDDTRLGASISINAPFGLETDWPDTAANPFASKSTFSRLQMALLQPNVIFKVSDHLSIAGGFSYALLNKVDLNNSLQDLNGDGDGWGGNASILYKTDTFSIGVTYRSRIKIDVSGTASAKGNLALVGGTSSAATTSVTLPDQINSGIAWSPSEAWTLSFDADWINWKTFDSIDIRYASAAYRGAIDTLRFLAGGAPNGGQTNLPQNWKSTVQLRAGLEWRYASNMRTQLGFVYDPTPVPDVDFTPAIPDTDRYLFSVGYGYDFTPATTIDLAYAYVYFKDRNQTASPVGDLPLAPDTVKNGTYQANAHVVTVSLSHKF